MSLKEWFLLLGEMYKNIGLPLYISLTVLIISILTAFITKKIRYFFLGLVIAVLTPFVLLIILYIYIRFFAGPLIPFL